MIRSLRPDEPVPNGEPRRFRNSAGYVRLRWRIGPGEYVECYEHRLVAGVWDDRQVHHKDRNPSNNDPANLKVVTTTEHGADHRVVDRARAVELYRSGLSTPQVAKLMGHDAATIYRALIAEGVQPRSISESLFMETPDEKIGALHRAGVPARRIAAHLGVSPWTVNDRINRLGLSPHRAGTPTAAERAAARAALARLG